MVDELIRELECGTDGLPLSNRVKIAVLAYTDDLVLFSESVCAKRLLARAVSFFRQWGMTLNSLKSVALMVKVNRGNNHMYCPQFTANGVAI